MYDDSGFGLFMFVVFGLLVGSVFVSAQHERGWAKFDEAYTSCSLGKTYPCSVAYDYYSYDSQHHILSSAYKKATGKDINKQ